MALNATRSRPWMIRCHYLVRLLGLAGLLLLVPAGLVFVHTSLPLDQPNWLGVGEKLRRALLGDVDGLAQLGGILVAGGLLIALLSLVVELMAITRVTAARRSVLGLHVVAQVALGALVLIGLNVYSFGHFFRVDCTRQQTFTLPKEVRTNLARLTGATTIVILQQPAAEDRKEKQQSNAAAAAAAAAVVVEKVRDLADQLRIAGAKTLKVIVLDTTSRDYEAQLKELTHNKKPLRESIDTAPGNSIIFHAPGGDVQRISFDDFLQLDRTLSQETGAGQGNLVLLEKGVEPIARRISNLEEKRPRIGILVAHQAFTTDGQGLFGLSGLKKTLVQQGFDVRDVILKREHRMAGRSGTWDAEPAVSLLEEMKFQSKKLRQDRLPVMIKQLEAALKFDNQRLKEWETATPAQLRKQAVEMDYPSGEELRKSQVTNWTSRIEARQRDLDSFKEELGKVTRELKEVSDDVIEEQARMTDLTGKLDRVVADCDLLLIARPAVWPFGYPDNGSLHRLEDFQVRVVRDFLRAGKPILVCAGAVLSPPRLPPMPGSPPDEGPKPDGLEQLLGELDIHLGKQPLVYATQTVESRADPFSDEDREVPVLDFKTALGGLDRPDFLSKQLSSEDNPIRRSLTLTARAWGSDLDLRMRFPRPVYYGARPKKLPDGVTDGKARKTPLKAAEFLWTQASAWNSDDPQNATRHKPSDEKDPARDTLDASRFGAFPVGVAVEADIPSKWGGYGSASKARVAVIGDGHALTDSKLTPAREKLVLDTCNWLLGRDDLLTEDVTTWRYPRLDGLETREKSLWLWGARLGLPLLFGFLGLVVLLARRVR